ncbi:chemotaxis protein CheW [Thermophagus sp. OGC60D27]|uniref:chemotaxis protein CheW n=1 Tax=Thermophagus sp. OGC60D27 TaxID=3458415 RepID=UPI004037CFCF
MESYLTFRLAEEIFAIHVSQVLEIREYEKPKPVPKQTEFVIGLMEFRNEIIPVIDTGIKFRLGSVKANQNTVFIVLNLQKPGESNTFRVAILVDSVADVLEIEADQLKPIRQEYKPGYVAGSFNYEDTFVLVLNTDKVFTDKEIVEMDKILLDAKEQK